MLAITDIERKDDGTIGFTTALRSEPDSDLRPWVSQVAGFLRSEGRPWDEAHEDAWRIVKALHEQAHSATLSQPERIRSAVVKAREALEPWL